jgi:hypothetical protein
MKKEKKYRITMTESQLRLMINAVEDWCRFLGGQCEMNNATSMVDNMHEAQENLMTFVKPHITPLLPRNASYGWSGGACPNERQRKAIAMSYMLYREPLHYLTVHSEYKMDWNVYNSETLTCPEQGEMIHIEEVR